MKQNCHKKYFILELGLDIFVKKCHLFLFYKILNNKVRWNLLGRSECFIYNPIDIKQVFKHDGNMPLRPVLGFND